MQKDGAVNFTIRPWEPITQPITHEKTIFKLQNLSQTNNIVYDEYKVCIAFLSFL